MANIIIVDDHLLISGLYEELIKNNTSHKVLARFINGIEANDFLAKNKVDLVITDIRMPVGDGVYLCKVIKEKYKDTKTLVISQVSELGVIDFLVNGYADGIINKVNEEVSLLEAIETVLSGKKFICEGTSNILKRKRKFENLENNNLTRSELDVLQMIVNGMKNEDIAKVRHTSPQTVQTQRKNIMKKLGVNTIQELIKVAVLDGYAILNRIWARIFITNNLKSV